MVENDQIEVQEGEPNSRVSESGGVSRRQLIASLGPGMIGLSGIRGLSEPTLEIVVARDYDGPTRVDRVPEAWWVHVKEKRRAIENLRNELSKEAGIKAIEDAPSSKRIEGYRRYKIEIKVTDEVDNDRIPDSINSIPIVTKRYQPDIYADGYNSDGAHRNTVEPKNGCYNDGLYSDIPGGVIATEEDEYSNYGTLYSPVKWENGGTSETYFATANHVVDGSRQCDPNGNTVDQGASPMGTVHAHNENHDIALIEIEGHLMAEPMTIQYSMKASVAASQTGLRRMDLMLFTGSRNRLLRWVFQVGRQLAL